MTALLLQVSVFRHWSKLLDKHKHNSQSLSDVERFLQAADTVLKEAEALLLFLGYHPYHVRRLLSERIELMLMLAHRQPERATHYEASIGRDFEVLERTADSEWWKRIVVELGRRVREVYPALGRSLV